MLIRKPLRSDVGDEVLGRIARGELPAGFRINESTLSNNLGISRTPLRESLITLHEKGILDNAMGRGFLVKKVDPNEARDTLMVLATLEPEALRQAGLPQKKDMLDLGNVLSRIRLNLEKVEQVVKMQLHWTALLLRPGSNARLLAVISDLHQLLYRYDHLFLAGGNDIRPTLEIQAQIMKDLEAGDLTTAADVLGQLRTNQGTEYNLWLKSRKKGTVPNNKSSVPNKDLRGQV